MAITIRDVAREAKVSITAASFALNGTGESKVSPHTRQRILEVAERLNYRKNAFGIALRKNRSNLIGVVFPTVNHGAISIYLQGMEEELTLYGYGMLLYSYNSEKDLEQKFNYMLDKRVDGILIFPESPRNTAYYELYKKVSSQIPMVAFSGAYQTQLPKVLVDPEAISQLATEYILEHGHRKIAIACEPDSLLLASYRATLERHQIPFYEEYNFHDFSADFSSKQLFDWIAAFPEKQRPTALICPGDLIACGVLSVAQKHNWKLPRQLSVMGVDGLPISKLFLPELTSIHQPHYEQARSGIQLLIELINGGEPHDIILQPSLSPGQSVCKADEFQ